MNMGTFLSFIFPLRRRAIIHYRAGRQVSGSCDTEFVLIEPLFRVCGWQRMSGQSQVTLILTVANRK